MFDECLLQRRRLFGAADTFDSSDVAIIVHDSKCEAAIDTHSVEHDSAGTALTAVATLLGSGKSCMIADEIEQADTRVSRKLILYAVNYDRHCRTSTWRSEKTASCFRTNLIFLAAIMHFRDPNGPKCIIALQKHGKTSGPPRLG